MDKLIIILLSIFILVGCNEISKEVPQQEVNEDVEKKELIPEEKLKIFEDEFPQAEIVEKTMFDIDNSGSEDLIVLFNTKDLQASIAVLTEDTFNAISLDDENTNFHFAKNDDFFKKLENPNRIILRLDDQNQKLTVDFHISMEYDSSTNAAEFKIKSEEVIN